MKLFNDDGTIPTTGYLIYPDGNGTFSVVWVYDGSPMLVLTECYKSFILAHVPTINSVRWM